MSSNTEWQRVKGQVSILGEDELIAVFMRFLETAGIAVDKHCRMISYKCYEATFVCNGKRANGYGRNEKEANVNCIRNLLEFILEDRSSLSIFSQTLHRLTFKVSAVASDKGELSNDSSSMMNGMPVYSQTAATCFYTDGGAASSQNRSIYNEEDAGMIINTNNNSNTIGTNLFSKNYRATNSQHYASTDGHTTTTFNHPSSQNALRHSYEEASQSCNSSYKQHRVDTRNTRPQSVSLHSTSTDAVAADQQHDKCSRLEEELKRAKSFIEHLERKVNLVVEENNILKSLLMESKKITKTEGTAAAASSVHPQQSSSSSQQIFQQSQSSRGAQSFTQQRSVGAVISVVNNENIPLPSLVSTLPSSSNKQPYFFPIGCQQQPPKHVQPQPQRSSVLKTQPDSTNFSSNQNANVLREYSSNTNIIANNNLNELTFSKQISLPQKTASNSNNNTDKYRSLSVDICGKPSTSMSPANSKLDTSLIETSSGGIGMSLLGHSRYKSRIPKLNLEILPNYHAKTSNKSINQQLLVSYNSMQAATTQTVPSSFSTTNSKPVLTKADKLR